VTARDNSAAGLGGKRNTGEDWRDQYQTPPGVRSLVKRLVGRPNLDVAASADNRFGADYLGPGHTEAAFRDGLKADWRDAMWFAGDEPNPQFVAWCNPPYSEVGQWMERCAHFGQYMTVCALVYERRETLWWREHVQPHAREVITLYPRVRFVDPRTGVLSKGSSSLHSCLIIWRPGFTGPPSSTHAKWT